jgi:hypothetical protein
MKDLISKMDSIQGVQTTGLPSTSTTQSGPKLLNERNASMDEGALDSAFRLGGKALGGIAGGLERVGNAVVQGGKAAIGGLANKSPQEVAAAAKASAAAATKKAAGYKTADAAAALKAAQKAGDPAAIKTAQAALNKANKVAPPVTALQKAGDAATKVGKTGLGAATVGAAAYGGKAAYDALTKKDDDKPAPSPEPGPAPGPKPPSPAPKPPVVGPTTDTPADDVDPRIDPYNPATDPTLNNTQTIPGIQDAKRPSILPADTMAQNVERARRNLDSMEDEPRIANAKVAPNSGSSYTGPIGNADNDPMPKIASSSTVPEQPKGIVTTRDGSPLTDRFGNPVKTRAGAEADLDAKYNGSNTRTDDDGRTYTRQKGIMGAPDSEQRSYASFGDFFNKIRGQGDVNGRMDEEVEQLLDAIIEAQEIDRITGLSGINEAVSSDYYDEYANLKDRGWKDAKNYKAPKDRYAGNPKYERDSPAGYGRYGQYTQDLQKYVNQLGYKDKSGKALSIDSRMGPKTGIAVDALRKKLDPNSAEFKTLRAFDNAAGYDKDARISGPMKKPTPPKPTNTSDTPAPSNKPDTSVSALGGGLGAPVIPGINASATTPTPPSSSMNASSLRAKLDAASGKDTVTPASTSAMPNSDDSGQPVLKTADEWQKDKDARQPKSFQQMGMVGQDFEESIREGMWDSVKAKAGAVISRTADVRAHFAKFIDRSEGLVPHKEELLNLFDEEIDSGTPYEMAGHEALENFKDKVRKMHPQEDHLGEDFEESIMNEANEIARIANLSGVTLSEAKMKDLVSKKVKGSYGTEYQGDEDEDDSTDKKSKAKDSEKKKRGGQFKGDKDTSGKEKFGGADDAMAAMGVGKAKKSKTLDKLPAKKHSLKEYFDETEAMIIAEAQHAGIMDEVADAMFQLETALLESVMGTLDEQQCLDHICECYPHEVKLFIDTGNLDPDLFHELSDHYKRHARVPHRIARERDVTPLFDLVKGLFEGDIGMNAEVTQSVDPMEVDEGIEDALQNILPKSMQPFNNDTAAAASKAQAPVKVREASKPW